MDHLHHPGEDWVHAKLYQIFIQIISTRSNVYCGEFYIIYLVVFWDRGLYQFVFSWPDADWLLWEKYIISFTFLHELETYLLRGMKRHSSRWWVFATINHTRFPYCRKTAGSATPGWILSFVSFVVSNSRWHHFTCYCNFNISLHCT